MTQDRITDFALSILNTLWDALARVGSYIMENPTESVVFMVVLVLLVVVAKFILGTVVRVMWYIVLPLALLYGAYVFVVRPLLPSDVRPVPGERVFFTEAELARRIEMERYVHTPLYIPDTPAYEYTDGELVPVAYSGITDAPNLAGMSFDAGIRTLQEIAETFSGEVAYCHVTRSTGASSWHKGTYSTSQHIGMPEACVKGLEDAVRLVHVHTHPRSVIAGDRIPPSALDIMAYDKLQWHYAQTYPSLAAEYYVVQHDRIWIVSVHVYGVWKYGHPPPDDIKTIVTELEPIYVCEGVSIIDKTLLVKPCDQVSIRERDVAIKRLLEIYRSWGIRVKERRTGSWWSDFGFQSL